MSKSKDWVEGYLTALYAFAWWKEGTMYVGSGVYTYQEIKDQILKENGMEEK